MTTLWRILLGWTCVAGGMAASIVFATDVSPAFSPDLPAANMPILGFAAAFSFVGAAFLLVVVLVRHSAVLTQPCTRLLVAAIFAVGLALRLVLLASEPILEADHNRYLWDGAISAHGYNPYAVAPAQISRLTYDDERLALSQSGTFVFARISYPELKTIYPPVAQAAFALAHLAAPWSLTTWRSLCIFADVATFALLLALLGAAGRAPAWSALYWWNPLVLKEVTNSAHLEALLLPFVLGALLLTVRRWHLAATAVLGLAIGTKLWPMLLLPLILRPLWQQRGRLLAALALTAILLAAFAAPVLMGGLDATSGFVAFATRWTTNSALFPVLEHLTAMLLGMASRETVPPGQIARGLVALVVLGVAFQAAVAPLAGARDLIGRAYLVVTVVLLASPAQFPWYLLWVLPLAVLHGRIGWQIGAALMPLYYTAFHFRARGDFSTHEAIVVWLIWVPIWLALAAETWGWRCRRATPLAKA